MAEFELASPCRAMRWCQVGSWIWLVACLGLFLPSLLLQAFGDPILAQAAFGFFIVFLALACLAGLISLVGLCGCLACPVEAGQRFVLASAVCFAGLVISLPTLWYGSYGPEICRTFLMLGLTFFLLFMLRLAAQVGGARLTVFVLTQLAFLLLSLAFVQGWSLLAAMLWFSLFMPILLGRLVRVLNGHIGETGSAN